MPTRKKEKEDVRFVKRKPATQEEADIEKYDRAVAEDEMLTDDSDSGSEPLLDIRVNVVSVLPKEFDQIIEVEDTDNITKMEMVVHKPVCYYVMNNGCMEEQTAFFEQPDEAMKSHLKPFFSIGKVEDVPINKILVDCGATVNLMSHHILRKISKYDTDAKPHNMVLPNYEGKVGTTLEVIQVELTVGTVTKSTMFMIVETNSNYNLLLGREWIHGVGVVPSSMHQRITIWHPDGIVENVEPD